MPLPPRPYRYRTCRGGGSSLISETKLISETSRLPLRYRQRLDEAGQHGTARRRRSCGPHRGRHEARDLRGPVGRMPRAWQHPDQHERQDLVPCHRGAAAAPLPAHTAPGSSSASRSARQSLSLASPDAPATVPGSAAPPHRRSTQPAAADNAAAHQPSARCAPCSATPRAPGDRPDRQTLRPVQPANLRPIIHRQHPLPLPGSVRARLEGGGSVFGYDTGSVSRAVNRNMHRQPRAVPTERFRILGRALRSSG